jgi:hypothetical protein
MSASVGNEFIETGDPENVGITFGILFPSVLQRELYLLPAWVTAMLCFRCRIDVSLFNYLLRRRLRNVCHDNYVLPMQYIVVQLQNLRQRFTI